MKARSRSLVFRIVALALISSAQWAATAFGDGGTLRAWKQLGSREIAVFTEPSPFVTGPVDISVLLLDRETGEPDRRARVVVEVSPEGRPDRVVRHVATEQAATNKLFRAAVFELRDAGRSVVKVSIDGPDDHEEVRFDLVVGEPWSPRPGIWHWSLWPLPAIGLYAIHRRLVRRSARGLRKVD
jgi:hypothetical protein